MASGEKLMRNMRTRRKAVDGLGNKLQCSRSGIERDVKENRTAVRYAILCDLDTKSLEERYPRPTWWDAHKDVGGFLREEGFDRQQGSVYFGNEDVDVVRCQMAVQKLTREFEWFGSSVKDIRMLRIEDNNDLMPAVEFAMETKAK